MLWILGGFFLAVFPLTVPLLKTKVVPLVSGIPGSHSPLPCPRVVAGFRDNGPQLVKGREYTLRYGTLLALDMLRLVGNETAFNVDAITAKAVGLYHPKDEVSVSSNCPGFTGVCNRNNSLRVDVNYWIRPSDLLIGTDSNLELGVLNICYKVQLHVKYLTLDNHGCRMYGHMYGSSGWYNYGGGIAYGRTIGEQVWLGLFHISNFEQHRQDYAIPARLGA